MSRLNSSFKSIYDYLFTHPAPLLPPSRPLDSSLTPQIASLLLHPTLEAVLHILNLDLPSAHFLVRHMQSAPAFEGMYLHGILHRIEGDYDNARAWYSDVREFELYVDVWGRDGISWKESKEEGAGLQDGRNRELDAGQLFLNKVQTSKQRSVGERNKAELDELELQSRRELMAVTKWCVAEFGTDRWEDASSAWVKNSDEIRQIGQDQVSGESGPRKF
jgi:hypothetical protein